jgi:predicted kinase
VRSDVERKRLAGLAAHMRSACGGALHDDDFTERTYHRLAQVAREAIAAGYDILVDAAFLRAWQREKFRLLASELGVPFRIILCTAPEAVLRRRIAARAAVGRDPSDADAAVLELQMRTSEPLTATELAQAIVVDTERSTDVSALAARWLAARAT